MSHQVPLPCTSCGSGKVYKLRAADMAMNCNDRRAGPCIASLAQQARDLPAPSRVGLGELWGGDQGR